MKGLESQLISNETQKTPTTDTPNKAVLHPWFYSPVAYIQWLLSIFLLLYILNLYYRDRL